MSKQRIIRIMTESLKVFIITAFISTIGGIGMESVHEKLIFFLPYLIILPGLTTLVGDFGAVVSTRFTTLLYTGELDARNWWRCMSLRKLLSKILTLALIFSVYLTFMAYLLAEFSDFTFNLAFRVKLLASSVMATMVLVLLIFVVAIVGGIIIYKQKNDPDNYLIPLTTSIADLGSILVLSGVMMVLF